ncbi:MAG: DUF6691 family protein [Deltaproteobacteria bacterium]
MRRLRNAVALGSGLLFALGLGLSGMTQPTKVVGFLDVAGAWDPSLGFAMAGGIGLLFGTQLLARRLGRPLFAPAFPVLRRNEIDGRLAVGAALFGIGWGLSGFCPGPALVSLGAGVGPAFLFVPSMLAGIALVGLLDARGRSKAAAPLADETGAPPAAEPIRAV